MGRVEVALEQITSLRCGGEARHCVVGLVAGDPEAVADQRAHGLSTGGVQGKGRGVHVRPAVALLMFGRRIRVLGEDGDQFEEPLALRDRRLDRSFGKALGEKVGNRRRHPSDDRRDPRRVDRLRLRDLYRSRG